MEAEALRLILENAPSAVALFLVFSGPGALAAYLIWRWASSSMKKLIEDNTKAMQEFAQAVGELRECFDIEGRMTDLERRLIDRIEGKR